MYEHVFLEGPLTYSFVWCLLSWLYLGGAQIVLKLLRDII